MDTVRVVRIPFPVGVIRQIDALVLAGVGGYETRAEFIVDAVQEHLLEMRHESPGVARALAKEIAPTPVADSSGIGEPYSTISQTSLSIPDRGFALTVESPPENGKPLFGLHNRDYPSLWALSQLAFLAHDGPVPVETFFKKALAEAWEFGYLLTKLQPAPSSKATALFPTNRAKTKAAETAFREFAIGDYRQQVDQRIPVSHGPLFEWGTARIYIQDEVVCLAVTSAGWDLLEAVEGLTVEQPHPSDSAMHFMKHIKEFDHPDWTGFFDVLTGIGTEGSNRDSLLEHYSHTWGQWSKNEVSTNAAGYVARAREWGLVLPKQDRGVYRLTALGQSYLARNERSK